MCLQAQEKFLACIAAQQEWRQIHHLCYWELMWAYSFELNWTEAYRYADLLCKESKWSQVTEITIFFSVFFLCCKILCITINFPLLRHTLIFFLQAVYVYQKAAILSMLPEEEVKALGENVAELFKYVCGEPHFGGPAWLQDE